MSPLDFVNTLKKVVLDVAVDNVLAIIQKPPGRRPRPELISASEWYKSLPPSDQHRIREMLEMAAQSSIFGALAVLDGSRQVENAQANKGYFELHYVKDGNDYILCGPRGAILHELM